MPVIISIKGDGLSLEKEINFQKAGQIIAFLGLEENTTKPIMTTPILNSLTASINAATTSPNEEIKLAKAKTNAQKITVLGNSILENEETDSFLVKEVQLQLKKMGEEPSNFTRDLKTAIDLRYIYEIDSKEGKYGVSDKGKEAIKKNFADEQNLKVGQKRTGKFQKATPPREEVSSLSIMATLDGYPNFHDLPAKADSILWVLAYADCKAIEELTPREVELLSDKLRNKILHKDFSAHNKRNIKSGFVSTFDGKFKIQQKGMDHLKKLINNEAHEEEH